MRLDNPAVNLKPAATAITCALFSGILATSATAQISFLSGADLPYGGEIVSFDSTTNTLAATNSGNGSHAVQLYTMSANGSLTSTLSVDLASVFGGAPNISSISSVKVDARGFGVATVIPTAATLTDFGRVAFFSLSTGTILKTLDVGYHPDSVTATPDGTKLLIANEGEYGSSNSSVSEPFARTGSVSVIDISGVTGVGDIPSLTGSNVATYDFSAANLGANATLQGVRDNTFATNNATTTALAANIEPEYITSTNGKAFVTLQENNAIAVLDFSTGKYEAIHSLGAITQTIDASDRDGAGNTVSIGINDIVAGLPMPDTVVSFTRNGTVYLATANEGDARPDDADISRANTSGLVDTTDDGGGDVFYSGAVNNTGIGRLNILEDQGNLDADAGIESPTMMGTRSFTIWNSETGALVFDSESMIEEYVAANDPTVFNINNGNPSAWDTRSDDKGPEPEALAFGSIDGRDYVFVGAERQNGIFQFDITDLNDVSIVGYFNSITSSQDSGAAYTSPESILFLSASENPTGQNLLVVGFEGASAGTGSIGVFSVVPEPQTWLLVGIGSAFLLARLRRRPRSL